VVADSRVDSGQCTAKSHMAGRDLARIEESERERYRRDVVGYVWQHSHANLAADLDAQTNVEIPMLASSSGRAPRAL